MIQLNFNGNIEQFFITYRASYPLSNMRKYSCIDELYNYYFISNDNINLVRYREIKNKCEELIPTIIDMYNRDCYYQ